MIVAGQYRSLRRAAEILNVRQSTLSRRVRDLEYQLGAVLFERTNGGTRPTVAGQEFLVIARRIIEETETAFARLRTRSRGENGRLTVGIYASLSTGNLRATLAEHHRRFPEVDVHTVDGGHEKLFCALTANVVDVAIMTRSDMAWDDRTLPLWSERVVAALPAQHPMSAHSVIGWSDLTGERVLLPRNGPGPELEHLMSAKLRGQGPQRILHQEVGLDRLLSLVGAETGIVLALEGATGAKYEGVVYREVQDVHGPTRLDFVAYWRDANSNPTLDPFLALLRERYPDFSDAMLPP